MPGFQLALIPWLLEGRVMGRAWRRGEGAGVGEALGSSDQPRFTHQYRPLSMLTGGVAALLLNVSSAGKHRKAGSVLTLYVHKHHWGAC